MKNILYLLALLLPLSTQAQYLTNGAQCGTHGSASCNHYELPCPPGTTAEIQFVLQTDGQASETSWQLIDVTDGESIVGEGSGLENHTSYVHSFCAFIDHCYRLVIEDSGGNGITSLEGYALFWNGTLSRSGGDFGGVETIEWGGCCSDFSVVLKGGVNCFSNVYGQVFVEIEGGTPPFQYEWSNEGSQTVTQSVLPSENNIAITVTDASGCEANASLDLTDLAQLTVEVETTPVTTDEPETGTAIATIVNGVPPFTYQWSNEGSAQFIQMLEAGSYEVTVTDGSGCSIIAEGEVTIVSSTKEQDKFVFDMQCSPNPTAGLVNVHFNASYGGEGRLQVVNSIGRVVNEKNIAIQDGKNQFQLNVSHLPQGQYWVGLIFEKGRHHKAIHLIK